MKSNELLKIIAIQTLFPLIISALIAYFEESLFLGFLLFLPISEICLSVCAYAFVKKSKYLNICNIQKSLCASSIPQKSVSPSKSYKKLHTDARFFVLDLLKIISKKVYRSKTEMYRSFAETREFLIQSSIFRMFTASLFFESNHRTIMLITSISAVIIPPLLQAKSTEAALRAFITLPQRSTVIFDGILRALGNFFLSKTFLYRFITKSQYAYLHSDKFVGISTYFWSFFLSSTLIFSSNKILALSGLVFMLAPLYLIFLMSRNP